MLNGLDQRFFDAFEKLSGIRGHRLDVTALALGIQGIERQRGLARTRYPGEYGQCAMRDIAGHMLEGMCPSPPNFDGPPDRSTGLYRRLVGRRIRWHVAPHLRSKRFRAAARPQRSTVGRGDGNLLAWFRRYRRGCRTTGFSCESCVCPMIFLARVRRHAEARST